jgi:hypothetical protein
VGRSLQAYLALLAPLGLSGCLLFTDPINKAPTVKIAGPDQVTPNIAASYTVEVTDEDSPASLVIEWAEFGSVNKGCDWITLASWATLADKDKHRLASTAPYSFTAQARGIACLCVRATDSDGASTQKCKPITAVNVDPVAVITDVSGDPSGQSRPLCSQIELSAEKSKFPADDQLQFNWSMQYSGTDSKGVTTQLARCDGVAATATLPDQHQCFYAAGPGTYNVTLSITDTPPAGGSTTDVLTSLPVTFSIPVAADTPPCLQRTDPDVHAQRILLSRSTDLGSTYQSRTFKVLSVADDCEPYPVPAGSGKQQTQFVWSVYDATQATPSWVYQTDTSDSFTVSQALFPNALPGDTIKLRVEVRDAAVEKLYLNGVSACPSDQTDICCGSSGCTGTNDCIRWTTWTVQFQP